MHETSCGLNYVVGCHSNCNTNAWKHLGLMPIMGMRETRLDILFYIGLQTVKAHHSFFHLLLDLFVQ